MQEVVHCAPTHDQVERRVEERKRNGEWSPPKIAACFSNDERTTASCSLALMVPC
jgi:hypothetical protein